MTSTVCVTLAWTYKRRKVQCAAEKEMFVSYLEQFALRFPQQLEDHHLATKVIFSTNSFLTEWWQGAFPRFGCMSLFVVCVVIIILYCLPSACVLFTKNNTSLHLVCIELSQCPAQRGDYLLLYDRYKWHSLLFELFYDHTLQVNGNLHDQGSSQCAQHNY